MPNIKSYRSPKTEIRNSKAQGTGLFAKQDIKKGELVGVKSGHIIDYKEVKKLEAELGEYSLQIRDNLFLCPKTKEEVEDTALFINHSCNPNIGPSGQITFVALRDIKAGEELCYDYAMTTARDYELRCNCANKSCRKVVTGKDWKQKDLQKKYGDHFSSFILNKIHKLKF